MLGIGPSRGAFHVPETLANPMLTLFAGQNALDANDDGAQFNGSCTVHVSDVAMSAGNVLAEIYEVP